MAQQQAGSGDGTEDVLWSELERVTQAIEAELKRLGWWTQEEPPEDLYNGMGAFGAGKISFQRWLVWVLLPRLRDAVGQRSGLPGSIMVAVAAIRQFDGYTEADGLVHLLSELDALINVRRG